MGKVWVVDAIALNFSTELDFNNCWRNQIFKIMSCKQFKFLAFLNGFLEGLSLFKLIFFFLKLKSILTKIKIPCDKS